MSRSSKEPAAASLSTSADVKTGFAATLDGTSALPRAPVDTLLGSVPTLAGDTAPAAVRPVVTVRETRLGRFTLLRQLGEGGMGSVFAAYDQQLDRRVALKLLHERTDATELQRQRTLQEARAVARISHANVISVYDVSEVDSHIYIAMEYVDGETLAAWQARGGHTWREILDKYLLAGAGMQAAHAVGVVHRDFKPENVLCGKDGRLRVADFGLARIDWADEQLAAAMAGEGEVPTSADSSARLTQVGAVFGTPGYMSPEQYRGGDVDARSDQWSFCAALFEGLYGYLPYGGSTVHEMSEKVHGPPLPPPSHSKVPEDVHRALLRGLSVDPKKRFPSMAELLSALALEKGQHAAAGAFSRDRMLKVFVAVVLVGFALVQMRQAQRSLHPRDMLFAAGLVLITTLTIGIFFRKTLLDNQFHRSMWLLCVVHMTENAAQRLLAVQLDMPMNSLFLFEMIVMAANVAFCGIFLIPRLRWTTMLPLVAAALSITGLVPLRFLSSVYVLIVLAIAVGWIRAAKQVQRAK